MKKTTIYIDVEDDIAGIADKIKAADDKIVALVLPKRPSVLQGSVNMNLLKRVSEQASKNVVLITNDDQVLSLAAAAKMYVSPSLQSKPFIPASNSHEEITSDVVEDTGADGAQPDVYQDDKKVDLATPIGQLANMPAVDDEIELDNAEVEEVSETSESKDKDTSTKKSIRVPNFNSFRIKLTAGVVLIAALAVGLYWALAIAPKASVAITTQKIDSNVAITVTANKNQKTVDAAKALVPAQQKGDTQKLTGTFAATGKKDVGNKAGGTMTLTNCITDDNSHTIPAGTGFSSGSYTFVTTTEVTLAAATFSGGGTCRSDIVGDSKDVPVVATEGGDVYNLSTRSYTSSITGLRAYGSNMSGGTSKIITVVSQQDVDTAKEKLLAKAADNVQGKVSALLAKDGYLAIPDTFSTSQGAPTTTVAVDAEAAADVSISIEITSSMLGIKMSDVDPLLTTELTKKISTSTQKIVSTGSNSAVVTVLEKQGQDGAKISIASTGKIGPNLDQNKLKTQIAGKKAGEAKQQIEAIGGVTKADIQLSPFWVFSLPKKTARISITLHE